MAWLAETRLTCHHFGRKRLTMTEPRRVRRRFSGSRQSLRVSIVNQFLLEQPGTGTGESASRYIYEVELSKSGHVVELHRPAYLNKGIDFTVRCPTVVFNNGRTMWKHVPRHDDLLAILQSLKNRYPQRYPEIRRFLRLAFECKSIRGLSAISHLTSEPIVEEYEGCPADLIVLVAKWLFVEQDITYWNNSGRRMLFKHLINEALI